MKIFEKNGRVHLQLKHMMAKKMLFDFSVEKHEFPELKKHMIEHLTAFKSGREKCPSCYGSGKDLDPITLKTIICQKCNGKGF